MFFFRGPRYQAGRRQFVLRAATIAAGLLVGVATLSGCGGGSSSSSSNTNTNTPATVTGRLIDNNTSANIGGITVKLGAQTVITGADGTFTFSVPANSAAVTLLLVIPNNSSGTPQYYPEAYVAGVTYDLVNSGYQIVTSQLTSGSTVAIGDIRLFSESSPPPPPTI